MLDFLPSSGRGVLLDIGCGNGFTSYLLSSVVKKVVASELPRKDSSTHSVGVEGARSFLSGLSRRNVSLISSSIERLPFGDETFDAVFAAYVLQYLKDRKAALNEMRRVVKAGGSVILMLPSFLERVWAFGQFYLYLARKAIEAFLPTSASGKRGLPAGREKSAKFRADYRYFPFPGPHGAYRNSAVEMIRHMPFSWNREFERGGFEVERSFATTFAPYPLILTFSVKAARLVAALAGGSRLSPLGGMPVIKYLGYNYCVVLKR
jgi:SAM-dependent methyltransferase